MESLELFAWLALNHNPPNLCLLSNLDYRCEPPVPGSVSTFNPFIEVKLWLKKKVTLAALPFFATRCQWTMQEEPVFSAVAYWMNLFGQGRAASLGFL
jgi:hypothetical protein